jgi:hypothetical protein
MVVVLRVKGILGEMWAGVWGDTAVPYVIGIEDLDKVVLNLRT